MSDDPMQTLYIRRTYEPLKFLGRLFWVPLQVLDGTPRVSYTPTWEANGERWAPTVVIRLPFTRFALGFGVWLDAPQDIVEIREEDAEYEMYCAVNGTISREKWDHARKKIAEMGLDPDEEMELMQAMGVFE